MFCVLLSLTSLSLIVQGSVSNLVEDAWIFDNFQSESLGKDKKSVGISILLRSDQKTLTDEDANEVQKLAINELNNSLGAELRS